MKKIKLGVYWCNSNKINDKELMKNLVTSLLKEKVNHEFENSNMMFSNFKQTLEFREIKLYSMNKNIQVMESIADDEYIKFKVKSKSRKSFDYNLIVYYTIDDEINKTIPIGIYVIDDSKFDNKREPGKEIDFVAYYN